jgi:Nucleotidyltransferase domain
MPTDALAAFVERLKLVPGLVAIVVGGSRARGTADSSSDTDLGLYYHAHSPLDVAALDLIAAECDDRRSSGLVTAIGGWGPWINGGAWLQLDRRPVDLLYRETAKVEMAIERAMEGEIEIVYQPGHPFGFLSPIYVGEVALCQPLWDPGHWVAKAKDKIDDYPERLRRALVRRFSFTAAFSLLIAEKPSARADVTYIAGCLFQSIACMLQVLFALNREHWMNEKGALALANRFDLVPPGFKERVEEAWQLLKADPSSLQDAIRIIRKLTEEVARLVNQEGLE